MPLSNSPNPASPSEATSDSTQGPFTALTVARPIRRTLLPEACMASYQNATACDSCRKITIQALISADGHRLHTVGAAKARAVEHCPLCELIVDQIDTSVQVLDHEMIVMRVVNTNGTPYCQDELIVESEGETRFEGLFGTLGIYTDEEDPAGDFIPGRRMAECPHPAASILLARTWIDLSRDSMEECFDLPKALPRRLIDVGHNESLTVHLRDFSEAPRCDGIQLGRYVCLSHRWDATSEECITTMDNLDARKKGIELCSLPATFQDAIKITRAVGRKYIWIDTLCIIQRSEQDWIEESAKMGSYYSSSWLTIGAGVESAQGLFEERRLDIIQYAKVDLHEPENSRLYFTNRPVNRIIGDDQNSILRKRAWTFQEEILSPRYLGFQSNQMYYRCGEYIYFESGCKEWLFPPEGSERYEGEAPLFQDLILEGDWLSDIIVDYSSRELSHGSDKLPAISGIAHERYRLRGGHYVAGLWEEDLPQALCWTKEYATSPCLKPVDYRAPSWSWAAIDGKVAPVRIISSVIEAEIVHVSTKPKGADPMGAVSGGVLVVCGVLRPGLLHTKQKLIEGRSITKYDFKLLCSNEYAADDTIYTFVPDTSDYSDIHTTLWFFNITSQLGLALIPVSSSHPQHSKTTFERVGLIQISMQINDDLIIAGSAANLSKEKFRTTITIV